MTNIGIEPAVTSRSSAGATGTGHPFQIAFCPANCGDPCDDRLRNAGNSCRPVLITTFKSE